MSTLKVSYLELGIRQLYHYHRNCKLFNYIIAHYPSFLTGDQLQYFFYIKQYLIIDSLALMTIVPIDLLQIYIFSYIVNSQKIFIDQFIFAIDIQYDMEQNPFAWFVRVKECTNMVFSISNVFLLYGVSSLYKSAKQQIIQKQCKERQLRETLVKQYIEQISTKIAGATVDGQDKNGQMDILPFSYSLPK